MPPEPVEVSWQVAEDEAMTKVVRKGTTVATPEWGHSVHVEVDGLQPGRGYWYQFRAGKEVSPKGRTQDHAPGRLRAGFAPLRLRLVPALRAGLFHGPRAHGAGRPRSGRAPGRLPLRVRAARRSWSASTPATSSTPSTTTATGMPSTRWIRPLQAAHAAFPGSSPGTTTSSTTTAQATSPRRRGYPPKPF